MQDYASATRVNMGAFKTLQGVCEKRGGTNLQLTEANLAQFVKSCNKQPLIHSDRECTIQHHTGRTRCHPSKNTNTQPTDSRHMQDATVCQAFQNTFHANVLNNALSPCNITGMDHASRVPPRPHVQMHTKRTTQQRSVV